MKKFASIVFCFLLSCASLSHSERVKQSEAHYEFGLSYMKEGKFQDAFVEFQKSIEYNPDNKTALNALGLIYLKFEDFDKAEQAFLDALDVDEDYSEAYNNLGVIYSRKKEWDKAVKQFENALKSHLYSSPERALTNLGNVYYRLKKYDRAVQYYKKAIRRVETFFPAYYGLALGYNMLGKYGDAAYAISEGIKYDPEIQGDRQKANDVINVRMVMTVDEEGRKDYRDLLEILNY